MSTSGFEAVDSNYSDDGIILATAVEEFAAAIPRRVGWIRWIWNGIGSMAEWLFGLAAFIIGLSIIATIPILQVLSLGYLLEVAARMARGGKLRESLSGVRAWARFGGAFFAAWLLLLPLRLLADMQYTAELLDNDRMAGGLGIALWIGFICGLMHLAWAIFRGGKFRHFLWPAPIRFVRRVMEGGMFAEARDRFFDWIEKIEFKAYAMQGLRGLVVAFTWLFVPVSLMVVASNLPEGGAAALSLLAGLLLATVMLYLPFLQINAARDDSLRAGFDVPRVRAQFRRAPIAYWFALLLTLLLAIPLYLLKAELIPREAAWLPSIVFVMSILPARLLAGWAVRRAEMREEKRHWIFRQASRMFAVPVVLTYVLIVYSTQYVSWYGAYSLYEQHAFLLPVPFVGL